MGRQRPGDCLHIWVYDGPDVMVRTAQCFRNRNTAGLVLLRWRADGHITGGRVHVSHNGCPVAGLDEERLASRAAPVYLD